MKIIIKPFTFIVLTVIFITGCTKDKIEKVHSGISAKILRPVSCTLDVYEIEADIANTKQIIGVVNLPNEFKKDSLSIVLDLLEFNNSNLACVTLSPNDFFLTSNVSVKK